MEDRGKKFDAANKVIKKEYVAKANEMEVGTSRTITTVSILGLMMSSS
jgi:hypothetical protein